MLRSNMRRMIFLLACLGSVTCVQAQQVIPGGATAAARAYSEALMAADCEGIQKMSAVINRHPEAREVVCDAAKNWKKAGMHERLRQPVVGRSAGLDRMVVVPNSRIMVSDGRPTIGNGVYVLLSRDAGQHWQVVDIACDQLPGWVRGLYPSYDGHPAVGGATLDYPTASKSVAALGPGSVPRR